MLIFYYKDVPDATTILLVILLFYFVNFVELFFFISIQLFDFFVSIILLCFIILIQLLSIVHFNINSGVLTEPFNFDAYYFKMFLNLLILS